MVKLEMGIWAGIAAGGVMLMLIILPVLGCMFSRSKKAKKAAEMEESAAEKGTLVVEAASAPAPTRPMNAILQKPTLKVSYHEIGGPGIDTLAAKKLDTEPTTHAANVDETIVMKASRQKGGHLMKRLFVNRLNFAGVRDG
ncbi:hypothetical protein EKO04_004722 [Ascochyta lentis]|uniref:Uncharacterized protein n=1 Tax=Ascochyta lentis TaxID=205686 RepID=A0A8H7J8E0_9PLEO|nr:hypothetical protein EKO04_004722 [Ascochyta lentis]